jgi:hypothetical protein
MRVLDQAPARPVPGEPYTLDMSTEDDLRRAGQTAAALMGLAATRAKQVAEQLLGSRENTGQDVKHRAESFFEESRYAAADVVNTLRREASVVLHDLEQLEHNLRRRQEARAGDATASEDDDDDDDDDELTPPTPIRPVAGSTRATKTGVRPARAPASPGKTTGVRKATSPGSTGAKSTGSKGAGLKGTGTESPSPEGSGPESTGPESTGTESTGTAKAPGARKTTGTRKATGSSRPPTGGQV